MKFYVFFGILVLSVNVTVLAEEKNVELEKEIGELIKSGLNTTYAEIREKSKTLNEAQRKSLYISYEKKAALASLLNVIPGAGIGSKIQGDQKGALILAIFDLGGGVMLIGGFISAIASWSDKNSDTGMNFMLAGAITMASVRVAGIILPFVHASLYNKKLALGLRVKM